MRQSEVKSRIVQYRVRLLVGKDRRHRLSRDFNDSSAHSCSGSSHNFDSALDASAAIGILTVVLTRRQYRIVIVVVIVVIMVIMCVFVCFAGMVRIVDDVRPPSVVENAQVVDSDAFEVL